MTEGTTPGSLTRWVRRTAALLVMLCVLVWVGAVGYLWMSESSIVFRAQASRRLSPPLDRTVFTRVELETNDGLQLDAAALRGPESPASRYWILFCLGRGNSFRFARIQRQLQDLHGLGYNVLAFDYRGFGTNGGCRRKRGCTKTRALPMHT